MRCPLIDVYIMSIALTIFCIYGGAAGSERYFKVRSRVHTKNRNRLSDVNADIQSKVIYNGK